MHKIIEYLLRAQKELRVHSAQQESVPCPVGWTFQLGIRENTQEEKVHGIGVIGG